MRGTLFFIGTGAFALGILSGTISSFAWQYLALSALLGMLLLGTFSLNLLSISRKNSSLRVMLLAAGIVCIVFPVGEVRAALAPHALPSAYSLLLDNSISLIGTIVADPDIRQKNQQLIVEVKKDGQRTNILVFAPLFQNFAFGERILIAGTLSAPTPFETDGGRVFRYDNFLSKKGIFSIVPQADILEVASPEGLVSKTFDTIFNIKHVFVAGLSRALPDPYAGLATGLLTGDQHGIGDSLIVVLALSGLIWVVVLSGYHVTLIAEAVLKVFSFLPRRLRFLIAAINILIIVFATGASAPSLRGAVMACFVLFAHATNRTYDALRALCAALILILLWNPFLLAYDSGFQLSIVVTPALLSGTPILESRLLCIKSAFFREVIAVSIVAQFACLPLILWQTGQLGIWAIPANVFVMSLVPVAMLVSVIAGIVGIIAPPLAPMVGLPAFGMLYYIVGVAKIAVSLPYANLILPPFSFVFVLGMYMLLIAALFALRKKEEIVKPLHSKNASQ